jgi:hypothetical protein
MEASPSAYPSGMRALGKSRTHARGGDRRRCDTKPHHLSCGIDLHARSMSVGVVSHDGEIVLHRPMKAAPEAVLQAVAPDREGLVVAVEGLCTWAWLADLGAAQGIPVVLGQALDMQAIHGGKAKHDPSESPQSAALLRGGLRPQADVYPAQRRATRELLRRRPHLRRKRAELVSPVQHTNSPDHLPALGPKIAAQAHRAGVAERLSDPAGHKTRGVDLARLTPDAERLKDRDRARLKTAQHHEAKTRDL